MTMRPSPLGPLGPSAIEVCKYSLATAHRLVRPYLFGAAVDVRAAENQQRKTRERPEWSLPRMLFQNGRRGEAELPTKFFAKLSSKKAVGTEAKLSFAESFFAYFFLRKK